MQSRFRYLLKSVRTPFGGKHGRAIAVCMLAALGVVSVVLWYALGQARDKARRLGDGSQLRGIGCSLLMFADDHNGYLADDFGELYEGKYCDAGRLYVSPGSATPPPASAAELRAGQCDYVYLGAGLKVGIPLQADEKAGEADPRTVIAYTKPGILGPWMNVLFPDTHTESVRATEIAKVAAEKGWKLPAAKAPGYKTPLAWRYGKWVNGLLTVDLSSVADISDAQLGRLREARNIRMLRVPGKRISDAGVALIAEVNGLRELDVSDNPITETGLACLARLPHLQTLWLSGVRLSNAGLNILAGMSSLRVLDLGRTGIGDRDLERLLPLAGLTELGLADTAITDDGVRLLANFRHLCRLDLARTGLSDAGLRTFRQFHSLRSLDLAGTRVSDRGMEWLSGLTGMETFFLSDTHVSDHGIEFLRNLKSLAGLCLSGTEVTDASLDVLRDLKGLKWVHLGHTRTTEAAQAELRAALPAAEILNVQ